MAEFTPFALAQNKNPVTRKVVVYKRDPYNFTSSSVSSFPNPPVRIPPCGYSAAGAPPPALCQTVDHVDVTAIYPGAPVYGVNQQIA